MVAWRGGVQELTKQQIPPTTYQDLVDFTSHAHNYIASQSLDDFLKGFIPSIATTLVLQAIIEGGNHFLLEAPSACLIYFIDLKTYRRIIVHCRLQ